MQQHTYRIDQTDQYAVLVTGILFQLGQLWPSDIWQHRTRPFLVQFMAYFNAIFHNFTQQPFGWKKFIVVNIH